MKETVFELFRFFVRRQGVFKGAEKSAENKIKKKKMNWKNSICLNLTLAKGLSTLPSFITLKSSRALCCASAAILKEARTSSYSHLRFSRSADVNKNGLFPFKSHHASRFCPFAYSAPVQNPLGFEVREAKRTRGNVIMLASKSRSDVILYKMEKEIIDAGKPMFFNQCFDKGRLKNFVLWFLLNYGESKTVQLVEQLKNVGFQYASKAGISLGIDDLKIPPKKNDLIYEAEKLTQVAVNKYASGEITGVERFQSLIDIWHRTSEFLKQEVISYFEATDILNPVYMMAFSGARGNISQVRQLVGMRGLMADPQGQIIDFPIRSNFREGLTLTEYIISSYGARKGIVDTALRTANAGYLTRRLVDVAQHVIISNFDCGTRRGIFLTNMKEGNKTIHSVSQRIVGRILARDLFKDSDSPNPIQIASRNDEVTLDLAFEIGKYFSKVFVRSALTCETSKQICQLCYGWSLAQGNLVSIGEAVGVVAAQSIGEPGTQLTMRTFHTGGVFSGDVSDQIKAPFDGIVEYEAAIPGTLIRTPEGRIAFLTKVEGYFYVHKPINNKETSHFGKEDIFTNNSVAFSHLWRGVGEDASVSPTANTKQSQKFKESLFSESKKFKIPSLTLLYIKNGQRVYAKDVIAQISSISRKANAAAGLAEEAELTIKSECEGQFYSKSLVLNEKEIGPSSPSTLTDLEASQKASLIKKTDVFLKELPFDNPNDFEEQEDSESIAIDKIYQSWTWGYAWILSGKIYEYKLPSLFFPKLGDFMNSKSYISQIEWKLNPSNGHNVFYDIHKRTPGNILNKKHYTPLLPSALFAPVQDAHQEKMGDSFASSTVKNAKKGIGLKSNESFNETLMCKAQSNSTQKRSGTKIEDFCKHVTQCENVSPMQSSQILFFDLTKILYKKYGYAFQLPEKNQFFQKSKKGKSNKQTQSREFKEEARSASSQKPKSFELPLTCTDARSAPMHAPFQNPKGFEVQEAQGSASDLLFFIKSLTMVNTSNTRTELPYFLQWFPSKNQTLTGGYVLLPLGETNPTMDSIISQKSHFLHKFNTSFFSLFGVSLRSSPSTPTAGVQKPKVYQKAKRFFLEAVQKSSIFVSTKEQKQSNGVASSFLTLSKMSNFNKNFYTKVTISTFTGVTPAAQAQKRSARIKGRSEAVKNRRFLNSASSLNSRQKPPVFEPLLEEEAVKISYGDFMEENELNTNKNISLKLLSTLIKKNQNKIKTHRLKEEARSSLLALPCASRMGALLAPSVHASVHKKSYIFEPHQKPSFFELPFNSPSSLHTLSRFKKRKPVLPKARATVSSYSLEGQGLRSALPTESMQALEMKKTEALESRVLWVSSTFFKIKLSSLTNCKTSLLFNTSKDSPLRFFFLTQPFEKSHFFNEQNELRFCLPTLRAAVPLTSEQDISTQSRSYEPVHAPVTKIDDFCSDTKIGRSDFCQHKNSKGFEVQEAQVQEEVQETKNQNLELSQGVQKPSVYQKAKRFFFKTQRVLKEAVQKSSIFVSTKKNEVASSFEETQSSIKKLNFVFFNKKMPMFLQTNRQGNIRREFKKRSCQKPSVFETLPCASCTPEGTGACMAGSAYQKYNFDSLSWGSANKHIQNPLETEGALLKLKVSNFLTSFLPSALPTPSSSHRRSDFFSTSSASALEAKRFIDTPMSFEPSPKAQQALGNNKTICIKGTKRINDKKRKLSFFKQFEFANLTTYCRFVNTSLSSFEGVQKRVQKPSVVFKKQSFFYQKAKLFDKNAVFFEEPKVFDAEVLQKPKVFDKAFQKPKVFDSFASALETREPIKAKTRIYFGTFSTFTTLIDNSFNDSTITALQRQKRSATLEAQRSLFFNSFVYSQESNFFVSNYVEKEYKRFNKIQNKENFYSFMNQRATHQKPKVFGRSELPFQLTPCLQIHYIRDNTNRYIKANLLNTLPTSIEKGATPLFFGQNRSEEDASPQRWTIKARSISNKKELRRVAEREKRAVVKAEAKAQISKSLVFPPSAYGALKKGWVVIPASSKLELWKLHKKTINPGHVLMDKMIFNTPLLTECFLFRDIFNIEKISLPKSFSFGSPTLLAEKRDVNGLYWVKNNKSRYFMPSPQPVQKPSVFDELLRSAHGCTDARSAPMHAPVPSGVQEALQKSEIFVRSARSASARSAVLDGQKRVKAQIESNSLIKNNVKIGLFIQPVEEYKKMSNFEFKNYVYESNSNTLKNSCKNIESLQKSKIFVPVEKLNITRFASPLMRGFCNDCFASRPPFGAHARGRSATKIEDFCKTRNSNMSKKRSMLKAIKNPGIYWLSAKLRAKAIQSRVNQSFDSLLNWQKYKYNLYNKQNRTLQPLAKFTQKDFSVFSVALWTERTKVLFEKYLSSLRNFKGRSEAVSASFGTSSPKAQKSQAKKVKEKAVPNTTKKSSMRGSLLQNPTDFVEKRTGLKSNLPVQKLVQKPTVFGRSELLDKPLLPYVVSRKPLNLSPFLISFDNFSLLLENQRLSNLSEDITNQKDSLFKPVRYQKVSLKQTFTNPIIRRSGALQNSAGPLRFAHGLALLKGASQKALLFERYKIEDFVAVHSANFDKNKKTAYIFDKVKNVALAPLRKALQKPPGLKSKGVQSSQKNLHPVFGKGKEALNFAKNANRKEPSTKINPNNPNKGYFNLSLSYQTYMVSYPPISKFDSLLDPSLNQNLNSILSFYLNKLSLQKPKVVKGRSNGVFFEDKAKLIKKTDVYQKALLFDLKELPLKRRSATKLGRSELPLKEETNRFYFNRNNLIQNVFESPCFSYNLAYPIDKFTLYKKAQISGADGKMQNTQFFYSFPNNSLSGSREEIQSNKPFAQTNYASPFIGEVVYTNKNLLNLPLRLKNRSCQKPMVVFKKQSFLTKNGVFFEESRTAGVSLGRSENTLDSLSSEKVPPLSYSCMFLTQKDLISFYLPSNNLKQSLNINYGQNYQINDILVKFLNMTENTDSENIIKQLESFVSITSKDKTVVNTFTKMLSKRKDNFLIKIDKLEAGLPLFAASSFSKTQSINKEIKNLDNKKRFATKIDDFCTSHMSLLGDFIMYGDPINNNKNAFDKGEDLREASGESLAAICANGQIIHYNNKKITLRRGQPIFISPKSILHKNDGEFIDPKTPVITLSYQKLKTGDIIQGIPKVEQFLEARTTKRGRLFRDSLPSLLKALFNRYQSKLPFELAVRQSFYKIQQIIVDGVQRVYKSQGVTIADKHLEVIVKQMTSKVRIIDGAQTGFFPGEIVDLNFVEKINKFLIKKITYEPLVLGITRASLEVDSFLSASSFQQTTRILSEAAIYKKKDFLKGLKENVILGNLIPAGTGYLVNQDDIYSKI
uniref:RNA polymerase beta'' subunit n=1 Tax=Chlorosarcinopsis eremi TaxID=332213 RepID=UPI0010C3707D|nr:RNA polymerase beta'' subunit [Chlorosarcinopsis eremi]AYQ94487.1 RNA polymerase beta'' subunit [Chlorosarcinopsis eremi]